MRSILFFILFSSFLLASVGEITAFNGEVKVIRSNKPVTATLGMRVENKDLIKTSNNSKVQIIMDDNTVITLGKNSEFVIEDVDYASVNQKAKFSALKGVFKVMTGEISKTSPKGFELKGRTSTIGIRGTFFAGEVGELSDRVACIDGAIVVTSISTGDIVNVKAGEITSVRVGGSPTEPREYTTAEIETIIGKLKEQTPDDGGAATVDASVFVAGNMGTKASDANTPIDGMVESKDREAQAGSLHELDSQPLGFEYASSYFEPSVDGVSLSNSIKKSGVDANHLSTTYFDGKPYVRWGKSEFDLRNYNNLKRVRYAHYYAQVVDGYGYQQFNNLRFDSSKTFHGNVMGAVYNSVTNQHLDTLSDQSSIDITFNSLNSGNRVIEVGLQLVPESGGPTQHIAMVQTDGYGGNNSSSGKFTVLHGQSHESRLEGTVYQKGSNPALVVGKFEIVEGNKKIVGVYQAE